MDRVLIAANWKMNKTVGEAHRYMVDFLPRLTGWEKTEVIICPPFTCLAYLREALENTGIQLGAQDVFWEPEGAFTGEISAAMLADMGCRYVIIGHSERRHILGENDQDINRKLKAAVSCGLVPIFCVGESLPEREQGQTQTVVREQLEQGLAGLELPNLVVAYEPVWAIGTGVNASPADAQGMCASIRGYLGGFQVNDWARDIPILYGGSVTARTIAAFTAQADINGALVGGASLDPEHFTRIVRLNSDG